MHARYSILILVLAGHNASSVLYTIALTVFQLSAVKIIPKRLSSAFQFIMLLEITSYLARSVANLSHFPYVFIKLTITR